MTWGRLGVNGGGRRRRTPTDKEQQSAAFVHVRLWHKADIDFDAEHVCFRVESGHP
jgi:hypothetical protein